ncbi:MAG: isopenicillin N synthase family oxygenase [Cryobacterium sp.]|nr:isopenicillin N synthase family oxygenase [Oligoflexia bacterium]
MKVLRVQYGHPEAPHQFAESLRTTGFAVIANHPIPHELISGVFQDWKAWFAREEKHDYRYDATTQAGYFPFKTENAKGSKVKDLKEFFHLFLETPLPSGLSEQTREMYTRMASLGVELLGWLQENTSAAVREKLSMPLTEMSLRSRETLLRPIHYPALSGGEEEGAIRAAAHEDINLITLLPAATAPGLEVKDLAGNWHAVECNPGDIVINAGDMLQEATGGHYISTTHRVMNPEGPASTEPRYSMPLFIHPRPEVRLSERHTAGSYLNERLREIGLLKQDEKRLV